MQTFKNSTIGALEFTLRWQNDGVTHEEWYLGRKFNAVNDIFPRNMRQALEGLMEGESVTCSYDPRLFIPRYKKSLVKTLPMYRLRKKTVRGRPIIPRHGRFYPQGHIDGLLDVYPDTLTPFRLIELSSTTFTADCNHPLATIPVTLTAKIQYLEKRDTGTYGAFTHWRETICDWGPGMQTRYNAQPTDFFSPTFFDLPHAHTTKIRRPPLDKKALMNVQAIHRQIFRKTTNTLDWDGHSQLPSGTFDGASLTLAIEYMPTPISSLQELSARLTPGSTVIIGFSNRFDKQHAIQGWVDMFDFERMGLVLEYLRQAGFNRNMGSRSVRNDWMEQDNPRFIEAKGVSDPIFVVWGSKQ